MGTLEIGLLGMGSLRVEWRTGRRNGEDFRVEVIGETWQQVKEFGGVLCRKNHMGLVYSMYCLVQSAGEIGWDQAWGERLKSRQADTMSEKVAVLMKHLRFTEEESEDISPPRVIIEDGVVEMDKPLAVWVRIYELPLGLMRIEIVEKIGNRIGKTIATDTRFGERRMGDIFGLEWRLIAPSRYADVPRWGSLRMGNRGKESSNRRREWIIYVECENNGRSMTSSANSPFSERIARIPQGGPWIPRRDLLHSSNSNQEDDSDLSDPTGPDSSLPQTFPEIFLVRDRAMVGTSEEEDPSEIPEKHTRDVMLTVVAENNEDPFSVKVGKLGERLGTWQRVRRGKAKWDERHIKSRILQLDSGPVSDELANGRRKKNWVERLESEGGVWCDKLEDIFYVATSYFSSLLRSSEPAPNEEILQAIARCISPSDNKMHYRNFTAEEVTIAFSQVNPSKAPGFDGLSVPKVTSPKLMKNFRPISLCSVMYKRGLRQGDPLSLYLFLFCAQGLSALLLKAQRKNEIKGIRASLRGPRISHLFPNTPVTDRSTFLSELGFVEALDPGSYLGLPLAIWRLIQDENSLAFKAKETLKDGFFLRVGVDSKARMFEDIWGDYSPICCKERYMYRSEQPVLNTLIAPVQGDMTLWSHHSLGYYSAKSGYKWLLFQNSPTLRVEGIWNVVAKANVLLKIRIFGWRLCHEALPLGSKIKQANLGDDICPLCNSELESVLHAIKDCPNSKSSKLSSEGFDLFLALLWNIWNRPSSRPRKWCKPNQDKVKINVDGAYCKHSRVAVVGIVARDKHGCRTRILTRPRIFLQLDCCSMRQD
ncbi:hypothetical protein F3Y22_tig00117005pilonHSYRG00280 [Hibiscus syriacus]|uniref:Reverse transcriptase zinc-binding domain-containing protein n=1 Tax=Hibiscus syriacus TaxID=106335 RepID=A0A6A2XIL7_HIBSY|nr:hypothetical protein F3Y22_tig00117005pilonHSYRG00280 [Hibiscus syriacus]